MADVLFAENAPRWMCISATWQYSPNPHAYIEAEVDPAVEAARAAKSEAKLHAKEAARLKALDDAKLRRLMREAKDKQLRHERSQARQAKREAEEAARRKTPEELKEARRLAALKCAATWARKRAEQGLPPKGTRIRPRSQRKVPPAPGYELASSAAETCRCSATTISVAVSRGLIHCIRRGPFCFVKIDEVKTYVAGHHERQSQAARDVHARRRKAG